MKLINHIGHTGMHNFVQLQYITIYNDSKLMCATPVQYLKALTLEAPSNLGSVCVFGRLIRYSFSGKFILDKKHNIISLLCYDFSISEKQK